MEAAGAAVQHLAAHLMALATGCGRAQPETDLAPARMSRLAPLLNVIPNTEP